MGHIYRVNLDHVVIFTQRSMYGPAGVKPFRVARITT